MRRDVWGNKGTSVGQEAGVQPWPRNAEMAVVRSPCWVVGDGGGGWDFEGEFFWALHAS